jgi:uncharacterized protein YuzE
MKVFYDNEIDAVYLKLAEGTPQGVTEMSEGVNLDLTAEGKLVGIEILDASSKIDIHTLLSYSLELDQQVLLKKAA